MLQLLNTNIIEYVLNLYLNYEYDIHNLKQLYNYKFNIKSHLKIEIYYDSGYKMKYTFIDNIISRNITWHQNGQLSFKQSYKNGKIDDGDVLHFSSSGILLFKDIWKNGVKINSETMLKNKKIIIS